MAEKIVLDTPINARPGATDFRIAQVTFDVENESLWIQAKEWAGGFVPGGTAVPYSENGDTAMAAMVALNKLNLSNKSLQTHLLERMRDNGAFDTGTISGDPD